MQRRFAFLSWSLVSLVLACSSSEPGAGVDGGGASGGTGGGGGAGIGGQGGTGVDAGEICPADVPVSNSPCSIDQLHCPYCVGPATDGGCSFELDVVCLEGKWRVPR